MAFEDRKQTARYENTVPRFSETCMVKGCDEAATMQILFVLRNGRRFPAEYPSKYINVTKDKNETIWTMREGYDFGHWITRCAQCYTKDAADYKGWKTSVPSE